MLVLAAMLAAPARGQDAPGGLPGPGDVPRGGQPCAEGRALGPGTCLSAEVLGDGFADVRGGVRRGVAALGFADVGLGVDLGEAAGLRGWTFRAGGHVVHGRQPTPTLLGGLAPLSDAEALSTVRLSELWLERRLGGLGSVRLGQLTADAEFLTTTARGQLTNGTFGWPLATSAALPSGGPAYPLAAPGVRVALGDPEEGSGVRAAVFAGDPGGRYGAGTDPQRHNRHGTSFSFAGGALAIAEAVVGAPAPGGSPVRPWVGKLGGWFHNGGFDDQRGDVGAIVGGPPVSGVPADPPLGGAVRRRPNNAGGYAVGGATLWRDGEAGAGERSVNVFARASVTPPSRNLLGLYADAGVVWRGPFGRPGDAAALAVAYARAGSDGRALDRALRAAGAALPLRSREVVLEANYEFAVVPDRFFVRPMVQWVSDPNLGIPDERRRTDASLRDALVLGLRVRATL